MKKICLVNFESMFLQNKTGVGICAEHVVQGLIKGKADFRIAVPFNDGNTITDSKRSCNRWAGKYIKIGKNVPDLWRKKLPIECIFGWFPIYFMNTGMYRSILPCKKIAWVHDMMPFIYPEYYDKKRMDFHKDFFSRLKYADYIVATSKTTKKDIIKYCGFPAEKIKVLYNGIDSSFFEDVPIKIKNSRIDYEQDYLLYIGDMRGNKNLLNAIKGFEKYLHDTGESLHFYLAGNQKFEYQKLLQYVSEHHLEKNVFFLGYVSDAEKRMLYRRAKALLFVSEYEGFGIPIIEAMASRTVVITSNVSSMKEIAEGYAFLVNPYSIDEISHAIEGLKDEKACGDMCEKAYLYSQKFRWDRRAAAFVKFLKKCGDGSK